MADADDVRVTPAAANVPRSSDDGGVLTSIDAAQGPVADTPIARFLIGATNARPSLADARAHLLSAQVLARLPDHPEQTALRLDARFAAARHLSNRSTVATLIRRWNELGIEALVIKGFHLAEFVYTSAALRPYHDVDLVLEAGRVPKALSVVEALGWTIVWRVDAPDDLRSARKSGYHGHEAALLHHPAANLSVDLHRRAVHSNHNSLPGHRTQLRLTEALLRDAESVTWDGARLRCPRAVDAVVFGLALNRCWGSDAWRVKARDYLDLATLADRFGITRDAILERAHELGVRRTVETYLERCDPFRTRLLLRAPTWWEVRSWNLRVTPERGPYDVQHAAMALIEGVRAGLALARSWRDVRDARRLVEYPSAIADWTARRPLRPNPDDPVDSRRWREMRRAVHRLQRLFRVPTDQRPAVAALAAYAWLRRRGVDPELRSRSGGTEAASAELWLGGAPLDAMLAVEHEVV